MWHAVLHSRFAELHTGLSSNVSAFLLKAQKAHNILSQLIQGSIAYLLTLSHAELQENQSMTLKLFGFQTTGPCLCAIIFIK